MVADGCPIRAFRTQDGDLLPDFYAVLRGSVNHQAHLATKGTDGLWHMPETNSPEYPLGAAGGARGWRSCPRSTPNLAPRCALFYPRPVYVVC